jgi:hypothetical protein
VEARYQSGSKENSRILQRNQLYELAATTIDYTFTKERNYDDDVGMQHLRRISEGH